MYFAVTLWGVVTGLSCLNQIFKFNSEFCLLVYTFLSPTKQWMDLASVVATQFKPHDDSC